MAKLPQVENAVIEENKICNYLLNVSHPDGWSKAKFFLQLGFSQNNWQDLRRALKHHAENAEIISQQQTPFGTKYVLQGEFSSVVGKTYSIKTIWFISYNEDTPKLVTTYPG